MNYQIFQSPLILRIEVFILIFAQLLLFLMFLFLKVTHSKGFIFILCCITNKRYIEPIKNYQPVCTYTYWICTLLELYKIVRYRRFVYERYIKYIFCLSNTSKSWISLFLPLHPPSSPCLGTNTSCSCSCRQVLYRLKNPNRSHCHYWSFITLLAV